MIRWIFISLSGLAITSSNWYKPFTLTLSATADNIHDSDQHRQLVVYSEYEANDGHSLEQHVLRRTSLRIVDRDSTAYCGSVNDPHLRTFDGR